MGLGIKTILLMVLWLFFAIWVVIEMSTGNFKSAYIASFAVFGVGLLYFIGNKFWYLIPFASFAGMPAIPLSRGYSLSFIELSVLIFASISMLEIFRGSMKFRLSIRDWWPMLLFCAWAILIALMSGAGLSILGSEVVGARRYLSIGLAVLMMVLISQKVVLEKEAKTIVHLMVLGYCCSAVYKCVQAYFFLGGSGALDVSGFYSWHQGLIAVSYGGIFYLFAKNKPMQVILNPFKACLYLLLLGVAVFSGKRMGFAGCCVIPLVACFWHSQGFIAVLAAVVGALGIITAVMIQNSGYDLPYSAQRVLHIFPGDWDYAVDQSAAYNFRETLNRLAWQEVEKNPVFGEGLGMTLEEHAVLEDRNYLQTIVVEGDDPLAYPHAYGNNWHNTWLGFAAIFGIPGSLLWVSVQLRILVGCVSLKSSLYGEKWRMTLLSFLFLAMSFGVMTSWTSGEISSVVMKGALFLGLLVSLKRSLVEDVSDSNGRI